MTTNSDVRELPAYGIPEAAHYLGLPTSTLRSWVLGQRYKDRNGVANFFEPVIDIADRATRQLSFTNLVEAHVLSGLRRRHNISLPKVRKALEYLRNNFGSGRPLIEQRFATDGLSLFVEEYGKLVDISHEGQLAMKNILEAHLKRIARDPQGVPIKLYLFTRGHKADEPEVVVIDPRVSFGRPVLTGTGIPTSIIAERYKSGESIESLARDYGRSEEQIQDAIRCELELEAA